MKAFKNLQTAQEMRHYLETYNSYTTAFHYTSLDSLVKIFTNKTLRFSQISEKNDKIEADFASSCYDLFFCLMKNSSENFGLWAMYGGLASKKNGMFVKVKFPKETVNEIISASATKVSRQAVAYTNINCKTEKSDKRVYICGTNKNDSAISLDKKLLSGYVKDVAWSYENEIRLCIKNSDKNKKIEDVPLSDKILKSLEVYPSPLYTLSELKSAFADKGKNCAITPHFCTSDYAGTVILKA